MVLTKIREDDDSEISQQHEMGDKSDESRTVEGTSASLSVDATGPKSSNSAQFGRKSVEAHADAETVRNKTHKSNDMQ